MNRCGYCKKSSNDLLKVKITSRGKQIESLAHLWCISLWSEVSIVVLDASKVNSDEYKRLSYLVMLETENP